MRTNHISGFSATYFRQWPMVRKGICSIMTLRVSLASHVNKLPVSNIIPLKVTREHDVLILFVTPRLMYIRHGV